MLPARADVGLNTGAGELARGRFSHSFGTAPEISEADYSIRRKTLTCGNYVDVWKELRCARHGGRFLYAAQLEVSGNFCEYVALLDYADDYLLATW